MGDILGGVASIFGAVDASRRQKRAFDRVKELQDTGLGYEKPLGDQGLALFNRYEPEYAEESGRYADELLHRDPYSSVEDQYALDQAEGDTNALYAGAQRDLSADAEARGVASGAPSTALEAGRLAELGTSRRRMALQRIRQRRENRMAGLGILGGLGARGARLASGTAGAYIGAAGGSMPMAQSNLNTAGMDIETLRQIAAARAFRKRSGGGGGGGDTPNPFDTTDWEPEDYGNFGVRY